MAIKFLTRDETLKTVSDGGLTVVNFYADWCGPCRMFGSVLEEVSNKHQVIKINVDNDREFARETGVQGIPATFIYKGGKLVEKLTGYIPQEVIEQKLSELA